MCQIHTQIQRGNIQAQGGCLETEESSDRKNMLLHRGKGETYRVYEVRRIATDTIDANKKEGELICQDEVGKRLV